MVYNRYPYKTIRKIMAESLLEYVKELNVNRETLLTLDGAVYRNTILSKMMEKDENIETIYKDEVWARKVSQGLVGGIIYIDEYLDKMLKDVMFDFNDDHYDLIEVFRDWEEKTEDFKMATVYAEELISEDDYQKAEKEFKELLKEYAAENNLSPLRAKLTLPSFDNIFDKIGWLEHELDKKTIDDFIEEVKDEVDTEIILREPNDAEIKKGNFDKRV